MKLKIELKVSANEVFEHLLNLMVEDIKNSNGESISSDKLQKNFSYEKSLINQVGNKVSVKVIINELIKPSKYSVSIESPQGTNNVSYALCDVTNGVEITYEENYKSTSMLLNWNYFLMSLIYSRGSKKKMKKKLYNLEQIILSSKDNQIEEGK